MPLYEYRCQQCGEYSEFLQRFDDPPKTECPKCGGELEKLLSAPAFHLKGSGWYKTDYAGGTKAKSDTASGGESSGDKSTDTPTEAKPAAKPEKESKPAPAKTGTAKSSE
ncbi:MAG: zinc ribbon domain-containing protein [Acidobacteria bacterium]|nr:zinc ribbon domain-containing protein [Acidobacteriota bacterium]